MSTQISTHDKRFDVLTKRVDHLEQALAETLDRVSGISTPKQLAARWPASAATLAAYRNARPVVTMPERRPSRHGALFNANVDEREQRGTAA